MATITLSYVEPDIAVLTLDTPDKGANILSSSVLDELAEHLDTLEARDGLAGVVVISGKPGMFIAGADLREFAGSLDAPKEEIANMCRKGQATFGRLSKGESVSVAAIDGTCVGGGAELAVWCDRRIGSDNPKTNIGFPEVKLGLFPGWGGTARAPRIVGLSNAVEMITGGESIDAHEAAKMGLFDDVVPADELLAAAVRMIRDEQATGWYKKDRQRWSGPIDISETELGFLGATASALIGQQTKGHYPAPMAALEVMLESAGLDVDAACQAEAEGMASLFGSPVNAGLLNVFFLTDRNKKDKGVEADIKPQPIGTVGVIGAGIMGSGIAGANLKREVSVALIDANTEALAKGARGALEDASYDRKLKGSSPDRLKEMAPRLHIASSDAEVAGSDLVIEAIVEKAEAKKQLFARLEPQLNEGAILASNTSSIPISTLAKGLAHPERFCGIHFFNPVRRMKLVEVIRGAQTNDQTVATAVAYVKNIGKMPIVCNDGPGFLVNRLLFPYMNEAVELLCEGAPIKAIEKAAKSFGWPMGPIELFDLVGLDTAAYAGMTMVQAFPDRVVASPLLPAMVKKGRLGKKSGAGFYSYDNKKQRPEPDPEFDAILSTYLREKREHTQEEIQARLMMPMLLEATRALEDNIVRDPRDVDLGLIFGLGFPPFKGGLMYWADTLGAEKILEMLKPLEPLGERMKPTKLLLEAAQRGKTFYEQ